MAQCEVSQRRRQMAKAQEPPNDALPVDEIPWAWGKAAKEPASKLLTPLIAAMCDTALGDAVFCVYYERSVWTDSGSLVGLGDGEFVPWTSEAIRDRVRSADFRDDWRDCLLAIWRLRRCDFAQWYNNSHLSAGTPLDTFWPGAKSEASKTTNPRKGGRPRIPSDGHLRCKGLQYLDDEGLDVGRNGKPKRGEQAKLVRHLLAIAETNGWECDESTAKRMARELIVSFIEHRRNGS
jgi:hypothetical protein